VASFDRTIPPGGEGKITLTVDTKGYQGKIRKSARVYTNDPKTRETTLNLMAFVKEPVYLSPRYVSLRGKEGERITRVVEIKAGLDKPLTLTPDQFNLEGKLTYTVEEVEKGRRFIIRFNSIPGPPQTYQGFLNFKTNYPEKPVINIRIRGRFAKVGKGGG
jgi:hypothetical protein